MLLQDKASLFTGCQGRNKDSLEAKVRATTRRRFVVVHYYGNAHVYRRMWHTRYDPEHPLYMMVTALNQARKAAIISEKYFLTTPVSYSLTQVQTRLNGRDNSTHLDAILRC